MVLTRSYSVKPESSVIETDKKVFAAKMEVLGKVGCEFIQKFSDSKISKYYSIVAVGYGEYFMNRVDYVGLTYNIKPFNIRKSDNTYHAIYLLSRASGKETALEYSRAIGSILSCETQFHTMFSGYETILEDETIITQQEDVSKINTYFRESQYYIGNSINDQMLIKANQVPAQDVIEKFGREETIDKDMNIILGYGFPFSYVKTITKSLDSSFKFFNEHFEIGFQIQEKAIETYFNDGVVSKNDYMFESFGGYSVDSEKGIIKITDFIIRVHYKIIRNDITTYAISLVNKDGKKTGILKWENSVSEGSIVEFIQSQGNYHFILPQKKYIIHLHSMIASTEVPTVYVLNHLGRNTFMGSDIVIYDNGVFDISRKKFFLKSKKDDFYFLDGTDGFIVQDDVENNIAEVSHHLIPSVKSNEIYGYDDYLGIFKDMYKDYTGEFLVMACMTYMGFGLFSEDNVAYNPIFCGYGVTGSGKTTFAEFIKMMLGIEGLPVVFGAGTTNYALLKMLGTVNKFPIMCSEFRAGSTDANNKEAMFRSLYDRKPIVKGRADQTIVSYDLIASLFMEGEELPNDGAVRSRFIHKRLGKRYRNTDATIDIGGMISINKPKIDAFVNSYQMTADKVSYEDALIEGKELLGKRGREPRIVDNMCMMYASCMAFDPKKKEYYLELLEKISKEQHSDLEENGTGQQILKAVGMYISSRFSEIYVDEVKNTVIFSWDDLLAFIRRQKIELTLQVDSYRDHLTELGWTEGLYEVEVESGWGDKGEIAVDGFSIHISKVPQAFLKSPKVYKIYKQYTQGKK